MRRPVTRLARQGLGPAVRRVPGGTVAYRAAQRERFIRRVLTSGIFDAPWYARQAGENHASEKAALRHYLAVGRHAGLTPSPLFVPAWYEPEKWRARIHDPLIRYVYRARDRRTMEPHPLLDPVDYLERDPTAASHPGGPLGHFLATASDDSRLHPRGPGNVPADVRWGDARRVLEDTVTRWHEQEAMRRAPRQTRHFDTAGERRLREELSTVPDPTGADGVPLVSVVMPVWNRSTSVRRAVESVQRQSFVDWELVIVDDGSTDNTPYVLEGLAAFDSRIRVIQETRSGVSRARNRGIEAARGTYLAFLDSDNTWEPDFLRLAMRAMESRDLAAAYSAMEIHAGEAVTYRAFEGTREHLLMGNHVDLNVLVARTDLVRRVGGFSEDLRRTVDYDLVLKISAVEPLTYLPFIGAIYTEDTGDTDRISVREPISWDYVVRSRHVVDWGAAETAERVPGRLSVIVPAHAAVHTVRRCVMALLLAEQVVDGQEVDGQEVAGGRLDLEILVLDRASSMAASLCMAALQSVDPRVRVVRAPVDVKHALAVDMSLPLVTGEYVAVCDPRTIPRRGWAGPLLETLRRPDVAIVQPLTVDEGSTIGGAGVTFIAGDGLPSPLLAGHPVEDAQRLGESVAVPALMGGLWAARTADVVAARGLDCLYTESWHDTDLSLRLRERGEARLVTSSIVDRLADDRDGVPTPDDEVFRFRWKGKVPTQGHDLWERAGFEVVHHRVDRDDELRRRRLVPVVTHPPHPVADGPAAGLPALRWAIKTAAPAGSRGRGWGDWHFGQSLASSLRDLGQQAVVDNRVSVHRDTVFLDDVNVVLRGLDRVDPEEGRINILWIISHPELVTPAELEGFDAVFAASNTWPVTIGHRWGVDVQPLLQCTDPRRFHPGVAQPDSGARVLFVGNSRAIYRPSVRCAVEAGVPLTVYGSGWEPFLPDGVVAAQSLPNARVAQEYAAAHVVLNDHWDDMRHAGFISNRVFDVVATGGRLVSDDVAGLGEVFGDVVRVWTSATELGELLRTPPHEAFPGRDERLAAAQRVAREHSFDARARQLLDVAVKRYESR